MDVDALARRLGTDLLRALPLLHLHVVIHGVEGPRLARVGLRDDLLHRRQEGLRVEEARHPEGPRRAVVDPGAQLGVALQQAREPGAKGGAEPRELVPGRRGQPLAWHGCHRDVVHGRLQLVRHHHVAADGQLDVLEGPADLDDDGLEALHLLNEEHGHGVGRALGALADEPHVHLGVVLVGQAPQVVVALRRHHVLEGLRALLALGGARLARLRVEHGAEELGRLLRAEGQVGVRVEAEDLGGVDVGKVAGIG
mmetsp:Transcript_17160/g.65015  ORF Transcript_17160/g.65015 Transcript_17160/m.65015 type:complete len:254 (+) Transcript_17160:412-1173(+)